MVGGWLLGDLLDRWWGTSPWMGLVGLLLGTGAAFWETVRIVERAWGEEVEGRGDEDDEQHRP